MLVLFGSYYNLNRNVRAALDHIVFVMLRDFSFPPP